MRKFAVVLVEPAIQGNIGAVARAMMNFGVHDLRIVGTIPIVEEARQRAVHAQEILKSARFFASIEDATSDLSLRVATTGIAPDNEKRHIRSHLRLDEFAERAFSHAGRIGLIFGRENYGLYNSELRICDIVVTIPTSSDYPIMNLSHAVSTVLYNLYIENGRAKQKGEKEKWKNNKGVLNEQGINDREEWGQDEGENTAPEGKNGDVDGENRKGNSRAVPSEEMDRFIERVGALLERVNYPEHKQENTTIMLRRILGRALISAYEYHRLMGVLSRIERALKK